MKIDVFKFLSTRKNRVITFIVFLIFNVIASTIFTLSEQVDYSGRVFDWKMFFFSFLIWIPLCVFMVIITILFALFTFKAVSMFVKWLISLFTK